MTLSTTSRRSFLSRLLALPVAVSAGVSAVVIPPKPTAFWYQTTRFSYCVDPEYSKAFLNAFFYNKPIPKELQP